MWPNIVGFERKKKDNLVKEDCRWRTDSTEMTNETNNQHEYF